MYYFVFDVESVGLYGLGFAVGWVVLNDDGIELESNYLACPHQEASYSADDKDLEWVEENVLPHLPEPNCDVLPDLYHRFWEAWTVWGSKGAIMAADCNYPVETNFLRSCILNDRRRTSQAPYPLVDLASVLLAEGYDPIGTYERLESEKPAHNPVNDARQSGRLLVKLLELGGPIQ